MFHLFGKFLHIMVRIRVSDWARVSGRVMVRVWDRVNDRISNISIKCHCVSNVVIMYTAAVLLSVA